MSRSELADVLGVKESYLQSHWQKALAAQQKQGIKIIKVGRGEKAQYGIKFPWMYDMAWSIDEVELI